MKIGIPKEIRPGERRVAATPDTVSRLLKLGFEVQVESQAGAGASFGDADYTAIGATVVRSARELWDQNELILKVQPPEQNLELQLHEAELLREGGILVSFIWPAKNGELVERLAARGATVLAMDQVPRITRAQKMDALSSMANIAGYRAVIEAASFYGRFFTGQMTAAGKVPPAKVLVIGAGVAGLAAIGAARSLGAIVRAFDTRSEVREQIQSMGAEFLEVSIKEDGAGGGGYAKTMSPEFIAAEMALFAKQAKDVDIIITTALVPGKAAPVLISEEMVASMRQGSVIVDLAAEAGGNCALTRPGEVVAQHGVTVIGYVDLPSRLAPTASQLYGSNLTHLLADMGGAKSFHVDLEDAVVRGAIVLHQGKLVWPAPKSAPQHAPPAAPPKSIPAAAPEPPKAASAHPLRSAAFAVLALVLLGLLGSVAPKEFVSHLTVFVLACFVGWQVVWNVTPALHTPLMSVTNAISGIILVGGMLQISGPISSPVTLLSAAAVLLATINISGGFWVTTRMLRMFQR
ncbi:MAG TPA: Re/Si-specific NAD(P)(+) transhydrogenase subunit alpha [Polyangiaceae bacterium]|nr:Re/Si-specific NAD(P)(+) transhydrogenase subunit alpha [Polyangiaceae bacterium]